MKNVLHIVGARPNFMKVAPVYRAIAERGRVSQTLVHTGQHYDTKMSDVFFEDLGMPSPDVHLGIGSGSQAEQTAKVMLALEPLFVAQRPDLVSVVGDVNSTLAATLVAAKLGIPVAHIEAGLRSFDRSMPEEINRLIVDRLAQLLLTPSIDGDENLLKEGVDPKRIYFVGNVMIDSLLEAKERAASLPMLQTLGLSPQGYAVCTLHRPANVDDRETLATLMGTLAELSRQLPVLFPVHPRTRKQLAEAGLLSKLEGQQGLRLIQPMGYLEFLSLTSRAKLILTDSGGLQEESTALGIPCLTLRENTERPVTVTVGSNLLVGVDPRAILAEAERVLTGKAKRGRVPDLWDGRAAGRIADVYEQFLRRPAAGEEQPRAADGLAS